MSSQAQQYFFFKLANDTYAIDAYLVNEMVEYQSFTKVPLMPSYVKGVTNIRGSIVTVVDLLDRLNLAQLSVSKKTSLVIAGSIALIIDEVHEVNSIEDEDIKSTLDFGFKIDPRFVKNMAMFDGEYIGILNLEEILKLSEISKIREVKS